MSERGRFGLHEVTLKWCLVLNTGSRYWYVNTKYVRMLYRNGVKVNAP